MPTEIVLSNGQKVTVVETPGDVEARFLDSPAPKRLNRNDEAQTGVWISPRAIVCFYEAVEGGAAS